MRLYERLVRIVNLAYIGELVELRARAHTLDVAAYLRLRTRACQLSLHCFQETCRALRGFAALGVVLGMLGVYGVVAYTAARQQRDFGIRLALGATRTNVRARFVRQALAFAGVGIVIGEIGAAVLISSLPSQLFGVGPWDPFTYAAVPVLLVALAMVAAWLPARRATTLDPVAVLRAE